jgi:hypothetical protein
MTFSDYISESPRSSANRSYMMQRWFAEIQVGPPLDTADRQSENTLCAEKKSFALVASPSGKYDIFLLDMRESLGSSANLSCMV